MRKHGLAHPACRTDKVRVFQASGVPYLRASLGLRPTELFTWIITRIKKYKTCVSMSFKASAQPGLDPKEVQDF